MGAIEWVSEEDNYECTLPEETQQMAKDELREDKNTRDQALKQMRDWIKMNPRIKNSRLGEIVMSNSNRSGARARVHEFWLFMLNCLARCAKVI